MKTFSEYINEARGPGGPQGNFNLSPGISDRDYAKAMGDYTNSTMINMAAIGKKFKAENEPHLHNISGIANQAFQQTYYTSRKNKAGITTIKLTSHPRDGWIMSINFNDKGTSVSSMSEFKLKELSVSEVDRTLQEIADKFQKWEQDDSTWSDGSPRGTAQYFPLKFKAAFNKRLKK